MQLNGGTGQEFKTVTHNIGTDITKIRSIEVTIYNDAESDPANLMADGGITTATSTQFDLFQVLTGIFDNNSLYNSPSTNRGIINLTYQI